MGDTVGRPMEILLVEDDLVHARLAVEAVDRAHFSHRMTLFCDGGEALNFLYQRGIFRSAPRPDLILLDLRLPGMDGLDVLAEIKDDEHLKSIPVVIMTSSEDEQDRQLCEARDVAAYVTKPVHMGNFLVLLMQLKQFWHEDMTLPPVLVRT